MGSMKRFLGDINEAIKSLSGGIELTSPNEKFDLHKIKEGDRDAFKDKLTHSSMDQTN